MAADSELRRDLRSNRCIVFVGAGVSLASTGDERSGWKGLIKSGVRFAEATNRLTSDDAELCRMLIESNAESDLLEVASHITEALGGNSDPRFAAWLNRDVGTLRATDQRLLTAILNLGLPIITTNYDDLLERAGNRDHVSWTDPGRFQNVLVGRSNAIGHIHGYYGEPKSIIFSRESYELFLSDQYIMDLRNSLAAVSTILYVGFGAGIDDPNFSSLRRWIRESLPAQDFTHYRLVGASDESALAADQFDERITPVVYGAAYGDLAPYIEKLETNSTLVSRASSVEVFQKVEEKVRATSLVAVSGRRAAQLSVRDLLIPPVLLPVSHDQYILSAREPERGERMSRCDLRKELEHRRMMIVSDASAGLTSALQWIVSEHHLRDIELAPLVVDFRKLGHGNRPLSNEIRKQLRYAGFPIGESSSLPPLALAIDNASTANPRLLSRVCTEIAGLENSFVVLGCKSGSEIELLPRLSEAGIDIQVRYIGRLRQSDVRRLAGLVDSERAKELADVAVEVVQAQHLPTTPFTFAMIISALMRGESLLSATSQTTLLDAYVTVLMGWGGYEDDSRYGMDAFNRSYVVEQLAELYVRERRGSLPADRVVGALTASFEQLEWPDSPIDTLKDLERRRLLTIRGAEVSFAQSSYLHLFAGKRALRDDDFRQYLLGEPLYFAPIIQHYAALRRDDVALLSDLDGLLNDLCGKKPYEDGVFSPDRDREISPTPADALRRMDAEVALLPIRDDEDLFPLDERADRDVEPFPLEPVESQSYIGRFATTIGLVSSVLRDTEIVSDPQLRRRVLGRLLSGWANFAYELERDEEFISFTAEAVEDFALFVGVPESRRGRYLQRFRDAVALGVVFGAIAGRLSSTKLARSLEACMKEPGLEADVGRFTTAVVLGFDIQSAGWSAAFVTLGQKHGRTRAIDRVVRGLAQEALVRQSLTQTDEANLVEFLVHVAMLESGVTDLSKRSTFEAAVRKSVTAAKLAANQRALPAGRSVLHATGLDDEPAS